MNIIPRPQDMFIRYPVEAAAVPKRILARLDETFSHVLGEFQSQPSPVSQVFVMSEHAQGIEAIEDRIYPGEPRRQPLAAQVVELEANIPYDPTYDAMQRGARRQVAAVSRNATKGRIALPHKSRGSAGRRPHAVRSAKSQRHDLVVQEGSSKGQLRSARCQASRKLPRGLSESRSPDRVNRIERRSTCGD